MDVLFPNDDAYRFGFFTPVTLSASIVLSSEIAPSFTPSGTNVIFPEDVPAVLDWTRAPLPIVDGIYGDMFNYAVLPEDAYQKISVLKLAHLRPALISDPVDNPENDVLPLKILSSKWEIVTETTSAGTTKYLTLKVSINKSPAANWAFIKYWDVYSLTPQAKSTIISRVIPLDDCSLRIYFMRKGEPDPRYLAEYHVRVYTGYATDDTSNYPERALLADAPLRRIIDERIPKNYPQQPQPKTLIKPDEEPELLTSELKMMGGNVAEIIAEYWGTPVYVGGESDGAILPALLRAFGFELERLYGAPTTRTARVINENDIPFIENVFVNKVYDALIELPWGWDHPFFPAKSPEPDGLWHIDKLLDLNDDGTYDHYKYTYETYYKSLLGAKPWAESHNVYVETGLGFPKTGGDFWLNGVKFRYEKCVGPLNNLVEYPGSAPTFDDAHWHNFIEFANHYTASDTADLVWHIYDKDAYSKFNHVGNTSYRLILKHPATAGKPTFGDDDWEIKMPQNVPDPDMNPTSFIPYVHTVTNGVAKREPIWPDENGEIHVYWDKTGPRYVKGRMTSNPAQPTNKSLYSEKIVHWPEESNGATHAITLPLDWGQEAQKFAGVHWGYNYPVDGGLAPGLLNEDGDKIPFRIINHLVSEESENILPKTLGAQRFIAEDGLWLGELPYVEDFWETTIVLPSQSINGLTMFAGVKKYSEVPIQEFIPINSEVVLDVKTLDAQLLVPSEDTEPWSGA